MRGLSPLPMVANRVKQLWHTWNGSGEVTRLLKHTYLTAVWRRTTGLKSMPTGYEIRVAVHVHRGICGDEAHWLTANSWEREYEWCADEVGVSLFSKMTPVNKSVLAQFSSCSAMAVRWLWAVELNEHEVTWSKQGIIGNRPPRKAQRHPGEMLETWT